MTKILKSYSDLVEHIKDKYVVVFGGYSGLGYDEPELLKKKMQEDLNQYIANYGKDNLAIVAGATSEGIGSIYSIASSMGLCTYGIVSNAALEYIDNPADKHCDFVLYIVQPKGVWTVKDETGKSLMVDIATRGLGGNLHYYNGGEISLEEVKEAMREGVDFKVNYTFKPNSEQVAKRVAKNPKFISEPLKALQIAHVLENIDKLNQYFPNDTKEANNRPNLR